MRAPTAPQGARRRVVAALAGAGLVVGCAPAMAAARDDADDAAALVLLAEAASASRALSYSGTQYVATWGSDAGTTTTSLLEVRHAPERGAEVWPSASTGTRDAVVLASGALDEQLLDVLRDRYVLRLAGEGHCTGRAAHVVEALRPGPAPPGASAVAARFWIDHDSGLMLRREVFDEQGRRLRSSAFVDLSVTAAAPPSAAPVALRRAGAPGEPSDVGDEVPAASLRRLREQGQVVPESLPGGFALFEARRRGDRAGEVLHLAYSDGLSTTSLFSQPGVLGSTPPEGFAARTVAGRPVWAATGATERVVWGGGGRVWTLVSDAPADAVEDALGVLPHEALPDVDGGWRARLLRGAARLADALNPFS